MDEFELIRRYFDRSPKRADVRVGIGDDGAVLAPRAGRHLVSVTDTMVSGIHFPAQMPPVDVGYRAVAVNVSDIAAMGATPRWMLLSLSLPQADPDWLQAFSDGLFAAARHFDLSLVGGDTTRAQDIVVNVQITGDVEPDAVMTRSGAVPGDAILVTGTPGDAAAGLRMLQGRDDLQDAFLIGRFFRPTPRLDFAAEVAGVVHAAIDVSDGLYADLERLLIASGAAGELQLELLPLSPALCEHYPDEDAIELALGGGDDYELCFTAAQPDLAAVIESAGRHSVQVTRIGTVIAGSGLQCTLNAAPFAYADRGFRHFGGEDER